MQGFESLTRLVYAFAVSAVWCVQALGVQAAEPRAAVEGALGPELRSDVVRAIGETDRPIENRFEARRRAREAASVAAAVLRSEGYYAFQADPDVSDGDAPKALVRITPGPRFHLAGVRLTWIGTPPDATAAAAALAALALKAGRPGRAADVVSAEGRAVAAIRKRGYADAKADPREVVVDHADQSVQPNFRIAAGRIARLDGVELVTDGRTRKDWLQGLAPWKRGETYDPEDVAELQRRLFDTGAYGSVTVALAPASDLTADGLRPIIVSLAERKPHTIEAGASYGTTEGPGADLRWTRYGLLGRADTLALIARISSLDSRAEADLTLPHWRAARQTLTTRAALYRTRTPAYDQEDAMISADVTHQFGERSILGLTGTQFTRGASLDFGRISEVRIGSLTPVGRDVATLAALAALALDRSDDPLNPKHGWRVSVRAEPTLLAGQGTVPYLKIQSQGSVYIPFGGEARTVLAFRARLGSILNGGLADIPAPQRFYAGGGGSVRGFGYQEVGPRLADNTPQGGLALLEGSAEIRHDFTDKWGVVAFVDGGAVAGASAPDFHDLSIGAGFGVRYNLGFGPIRVDVATPVTHRRGAAPFQIYVSIGQAF
jgi:translocation and assembly module TamA